MKGSAEGEDLWKLGITQEQKDWDELRSQLCRASSQYENHKLKDSWSGCLRSFTADNSILRLTMYGEGPERKRREFLGILQMRERTKKEVRGKDPKDRKAA